MNQLSSQRNRVIDAAKGIGILLVIFGHLNSYSTTLQVITYSFHIPLFYVLSGMMFRREKYPTFGAFFKKRFRTLIIPYLFFSFISFPIWSLMAIYPMGFTRENVSQIPSYFVQIFIAQNSGTVCNTPLWFVPNLFVIECIYYFISDIKSRNLHWLTVLVLVAAGWFTESAYCPVDFSFLPWNISSALFAQGFYAIGNHFPKLLTDPVPTLEKKSRIGSRLLVVVICFSLLVPLALYNGGVSFGRRDLENGFVFYATGLLGTVGTLSLAALLQSSWLLNYCGRNSFCIMSTHKLFQVLIDDISRVVFHISITDLHEKWPVLMLLLSFVVITLLSMIASFFYQKLQLRLRRQRTS